MLTLFLSQSSSARIYQVGTLNQSEVAVYTGSRSSKSFVVIGKVTVEGHNRQDLLERMKKKAKEYGGDAVLMYKVVESGNVPLLYTDLAKDNKTVNAFGTGGNKIPAAEGVIIKYDKSGATSISDNKSLKVLE